jgi:hypothetical protein
VPTRMVLTRSTLCRQPRAEGAAQRPVKFCCCFAACFDDVAHSVGGARDRHLPARTLCPRGAGAAAVPLASPSRDTARVRAADRWSLDARVVRHNEAPKPAEVP